RAVLIRRDDTRCSIRQMVSPIMKDRDEFCGLVIVFQDFTDARALQRQLAYAAAHDALTGLANRPSFIRTMEELVDRCRLNGGEHQFMFVDLDHFKAVNDTGGHAAGDALLK
ncbi:MAG: diguanylate cyclase, partial [Mesorhizobium sp.]